jgi:hypothetical protein
MDAPRRDHHGAQISQHNNISHWGDTLNTKDNKCVRIGCRNVNSLPITQVNSRNDELFQDISSAHIDVFGLSEINVAWNKVDYNQQPHARFHGCFENLRLGYSYNNTDPDWLSPYQPGGTMILCTGTAANRSLQFGSDESGLGRWTWVVLQGREQRKIRIFSVYRPVKSYGATSTYRQQQRFFCEQQNHPKGTTGAGASYCYGRLQ